MNAEPEGDAKAGFCSNCRRGDHTLCASPTCTCPDMRRHRNRPGFAVVDAQGAPRSPRPVEPLRPRLAPRERELPTGAEWCDPPARSGPGSRHDYVALAAPCLTRPGEWLRIRHFPAKTSAASAARPCRAQLGAGWEVRASHLPDGSGLWVRWMGEPS